MGSSGNTYVNLAPCFVTAAKTPPESLAFLSFFFEPASPEAPVSFCFLLRGPFVPEEDEAGEGSRIDEPGIQEALLECWGSFLLASRAALDEPSSRTRTGQR
jgi:hypothetical protein